MVYSWYTHGIHTRPTAHLPQKPLAEAALAPEVVFTDFAKMDRPGQLHVGFLVGWPTAVAMWPQQLSAAGDSA